jgi:hypothetical protein
MAFYAGFDAAVYPGLPAMNWLRAHSNLVWCGYYLSPAPNLYPPALSWSGKRRELAAHWGLAPIYVGQQINVTAQDDFSAVLTVAQGLIDGRQAADNARRDGFPPGTCLFLDWENGGTLSQAALRYAGAWFAAVHGSGFMPGVYCSHRLGVEFQQLMLAAVPRQPGRIWCYRVSSTAAHQLQTPLAHLPQTDPAGAGFAPSTMWQHEMNAWFDLPLPLPSAALAAGHAPPGGAPDQPTPQRVVADFSTARLADPGKGT